MNALMYVLLIIFTAPAFAQTAPDCDGFLQGFNRWEIKLKGKLEPRISYFTLTDWEHNSKFEGVVITAAQAKALKKPVFEIAYRPANRREKGHTVSYGKTDPLTGDASRLHFSDFKPSEFFKFNQPGLFEVRLKDGSALICRSTRNYSVGD